MAGFWFTFSAKFAILFRNEKDRRRIEYDHLHQMRRADRRRGIVLRKLRAERCGSAAKTCSAPCRENADPAAAEKAAGGTGVCCEKTCRFAFDGHSCNLLHPASGCWRIFVSDRQRKAAQSAGGTRPAAGGNIVFDQYAVCVNVGSEVYHRYGCTLFKPENFEILNEKLAEAEGYLSCPVCIGQ